MSCRDCKWCDDTITRNGNIKCTHPESPWQWCAIDVSCRRFMVKPQTVFDSITASLEALAEKMVYAVHYGGLYFWHSTLIYPAFPFETREKAIAATIEKLKEVNDADKGSMELS